MALQHVLGQEYALKLLMNALSYSRLAHAYLFTGPPGVGKALAARQFAKALYCTSGLPDACDECVVCHKIEVENHPDVVEIAPDGATLRIEHIRTLQHRLSYRPYENQRITIILDGCEQLSTPAANALLKTLEEPPAHALLLLLTSNKTALPLTLVSRCQLVPFRALSPAHIRTLLQKQGVDVEAATLAATLSQGGMGDYGDLADALPVRQRACELLTEVSQNQGIAVFNQARKLAGKREQCDALLQWIELLCRDLVILSVASERPLYNDDLRVELTALAARMPIDALLEMFVFIDQLRQYLGMNLNPQLVFERLIVHMQQTIVASSSQ